MHNIVIAGSGRTKRSQAVRSLEELIARTSEPIITIPLHTPKSDDIPEVLAWAYGTAKRLGVTFNVVMIEEDYDLATERDQDEDYDLVNRLIKDANDVVLVAMEAQVFSIATQDADEVVLAWADEDPTSARVLRLAQKRGLPVTDLTASIDPSAGETDDEEDDEALEIPDTFGTVTEADVDMAREATEFSSAAQAEVALATPWEEPQDRLTAAIEALVEALVATVLERVTARLKAAQ